MVHIAEKGDEYLKNIVPMEPLTNQQNQEFKIYKNLSHL